MLPESRAGEAKIAFMVCWGNFSKAAFVGANIVKEVALEASTRTPDCCKAETEWGSHAYK